MEIKVEDLRLGDEFLYSVNGTIARAKVIRPIAPKKVPPNNSYYQGKVFYKAVKCKVAMVEKTYNSTWNGVNRTWVRKEYCASDNYVVEKFIDLNWRNVWLLKRED